MRKAVSFKDILGVYILSVSGPGGSGLHLLLELESGGVLDHLIMITDN